MDAHFNKPFKITDDIRKEVKKFEEYMIKKDAITYKHCKDVETKVRSFYLSLNNAFWEKAGVPKECINDKIDELSFGALMHDAGKLFIDDSVLKKDGSLSEKEFAAIKEHPQMGLDFLSKDLLKSDIIKDSILYHHESYNGPKGYPTHITGNEIPFAAIVVAVADVHDALSAKRQYKDIIPQDKVVEMLRTDPKLDQTIVKAASDLFVKMELDNERIGNDISRNLFRTIENNVNKNNIFALGLDDKIKQLGDGSSKNTNNIKKDSQER